MHNFKYLAKSDSGGLVRGRTTAADASDARRKLQLQGLTLVSLSKDDSKQPAKFPQEIWRQLTRTRLRSADAEMLLEQVAVMLKGGLELDSALREIGQHAHSRSIAKCCTQLIDKIQAGSALADAFQELGTFPNLICKLTSVGEQTGKLAESLEQAAHYLRQRRQTTSSLTAALAYPIVVAVASIGVAFYLVVSAIPKLGLFLQSMGRDLPQMTQSLLDLTSWLRNYGTHCIVLGIVASLALILFRRWPAGRLWTDRLTLKLPLLGGLLQTMESHRFSSGLAIMLQNGVRLQDALQTVSSLHHNHHVAQVVTQARSQICSGSLLSTALRSSNTLAPLVGTMIAVGEKTGDLAQSVSYAAEHLAAQLQRKLTQLSRMIEPAIIVVVGLLVGYVYVAFFMALLSAGGNVR